jgi:hypothetical protein
LELSWLTAIPAAHPQGKAQRSLALAHPLAQRQHAPRIAAGAVGRELVVVFIESRDAAEVDHGVTVAPRRESARELSRVPDRHLRTGSARDANRSDSNRPRDLAISPNCTCCYSRAQGENTR